MFSGRVMENRNGRECAYLGQIHLPVKAASRWRFQVRPRRRDRTRARSSTIELRSESEINKLGESEDRLAPRELSRFCLFLAEAREMAYFRGHEKKQRQSPGTGLMRASDNERDRERGRPVGSPVSCCCLIKIQTDSQRGLIPSRCSPPMSS